MYISVLLHDNISLDVSPTYIIPQNCTSFHSTVHNSTALHIIPQHFTSFHSTAHHSTALHIIPQHCTSFHSTVHHSTALYITPQHCTSFHSTVHHSTALYSMYKFFLLRFYTHLLLFYFNREINKKLYDSYVWNEGDSLTVTVLLVPQSSRCPHDWQKHVVDYCVIKLHSYYPAQLLVFLKILHSISTVKYSVTIKVTSNVIIIIIIINLYIFCRRISALWF